MTTTTSNNETFDAKRIAYCVHVDHENDRISRMYAWEMPADMPRPHFGETLLVENMDDTARVFFIIERQVIPIEPVDRKKVLGVSSKKISLYSENHSLLFDAFEDIKQGIHTPDDFLGAEDGEIIGWRIPTEEQDVVPPRRERRSRSSRQKSEGDHLIREIRPEEIKPGVLYVEIDAESVAYAREHAYNYMRGTFFLLGHNNRGGLGELCRREVHVRQEPAGLIANLMGVKKISADLLLKNPRGGYKPNPSSSYFEFVEGKEELLDGFKHEPLTTIGVTEREFTLEDGTKCRFVPAMENLKLFPWMAPGDDRVIHQLKYKNTKWLYESQLEEARRHLADDGQVYMLQVFKEMAGKFYWDTVVQTTDCHLYRTPIIFNATSTKKEAFEEEPRFATAYVYQSGVNQYKSISLYQPFWYSPGNCSDYRDA